MAAVIDLTIADVQLEHARALRSGRIWKGRLIRVAASIVFLKVMAICIWRVGLAPYAAAWLPNLTLMMFGTALVWHAQPTTWQASA